MKTEHTQGPWKAHVAHESLNVVTDSVVTVDGLHVADVASYGASIATRNANARLIAAAPDLLAALNEVLGDLCDFQDAYPDLSNQFDGTFAKINAVLSKVEGNA